MRMIGHSYWFEQSVRITDAVLLPGKLSIDFVDDTGAGHLEAASTDHVTYSGTFGYPQLTSHRHVEFELYRAANGNAVLLGRWWNAQTGSSGDWLIKLTRSDTGT